MTRALAILTCMLVLASCGSQPDKVEDFGTLAVTLPDGTSIRAEAMMKQADMMRGMMFRDSLPEGRGMLFFHGSPGEYPYWMYQVKIPLDIIWLNLEKRVVEISPNTPPCTAKPRECPNYGGRAKSVYVLELPAGSAAKHGIEIGTALRF